MCTKVAVNSHILHLTQFAQQFVNLAVEYNLFLSFNINIYITPIITRDLENNKFILRVLEMSLNFTKLGNFLGKMLPVNKFT